MFGFVKEQRSMAVKQYAKKLFRHIFTAKTGEFIPDGSISPKTAYEMGQVEMRDRILNHITYSSKIERNEVELELDKDESKVFWRSVKVFGYPPDDADAVLVTMRTFAGDVEVFEAVWNGRCWTDTYQGYYNFEKNDDGEKYAEITHWAYMPEPPKEKLI